MPNITVEGPAVSADKKRELATEITDIASRVYGIPKQGFVVVIRENPPENVCVGGRMVCDDRAVRTTEEDKGY
jgi:4-oxalocrotonate tautomerase